MKGHNTIKILFETKNWDVEVEIFKTCSCPLIQYLGALFWDENWVNKVLIGPQQVFPKYRNKGHDVSF